MREYMIPKSVTTRIEFAPGVGTPEVVAGAVGAGVAYMLYRLAGAVHIPLQFVAGPILIIAAGPYGLVAFGPHLLRRLRFGQQQQKFLYRLGRRM